MMQGAAQVASEKTATANGLERSRLTKRLFMLFAVYLVIPIIDVPLLGLSLSAPILFLIALEVFLRPQRLNLTRYSRWITIGYFFWLGLLLSLAVNGIIGKIQLESGDVLTLIRWAYWIIAFITTVILVSSTSIAPQLSSVMGISILVLTGMRLFEGIVFGRWGAWTGVQIISQNGYGILFSMFAPYAFMLPFTVSSRWRVPAIIGVIGMVFAIAGNGSRSSWIAVSIGLLTFFSIYAITQRGGLLKVPVLLSLSAGLFLIVVSVLPDSALAPINDRFVTFERIEQDKSFAIRELMIQKGERLFLDSPLIGAGVGRFRDASVPLDIPQVLSYAGQDHFDVKSSHNSYIALMGETGLAGMVPYAILMLVLAIGGLRSVVRLARAGVIWPIAACASFIGMTIHLWALSGLTGTAPWFIYGLVAGIIEYERSTNPHFRML